MQCKTGVETLPFFCCASGEALRSFAFFCRKGGIFKKQNNPDFPASQQMKGI